VFGCSAIAIGNFFRVAGRQHQELDARALIDSEQPRILQRLLPDVDDVAVERTVGACRRDFDHDRPDIPGVEKRHEV
jgi:hypothetical protein